MFALVRAAGGGRGSALGAAALMAADNLMLVHGRIGTLDIYAIAAMVWAAAMYLRGRPVVAGVIVGVGACAKLVAPYVLLVFACSKRCGGSATGRARGRRCRGWGGASVAAAGCVHRRCSRSSTGSRRRTTPPTGKLVVGGPVRRTLAHPQPTPPRQTSPHGPTGIASYPWDWLVDFKPIMYLRDQPCSPDRAARPDPPRGPLPRA